MSGDLNSYHWALQYAGYKVLAFEYFGSYQGDWIAKVEIDGQVGWIKDYYGSCPVCDAFAAECDHEDRTKKEWKSFCKKFVKYYISEIRTYEEVLEEAKTNISWDSEAKDMVKWIEANRLPVKPNK